MSSPQTSAPEPDAVDGAGDRAFTDELLAASQPAWDQATGHRFVRELVDGSLPEAVHRAYLLQDYAFLEGLLGVVGQAVTHAPSLDAKGRFAGFLFAVTGEENDHFERAFDALGVPESTWQDPPVARVTQAFLDLFEAAGDHGTYHDTLSVLLPVEWIYLSWARQASTRPDQALLAEWIDLHDNEPFASFVHWIQSELDALGPHLTDEERARVTWRFRRAVELEVAFWDQAYELAKEGT